MSGWQRKVILYNFILFYLLSYSLHLKNIENFNPIRHGVKKQPKDMGGI